MRNISSIYINSTCSWGRALGAVLLGPCSWGRRRVTHLLHLLVEEGTKVVSVIVQNALNISCLLDSWVDLCHDSLVCDNKP